MCWNISLNICIDTYIIWLGYGELDGFLVDPHTHTSYTRKPRGLGGRRERENAIKL